MTEEKREYDCAGWVYLIKPTSHNVYKIGCTTNLEKRLVQNSKKAGKPMEYVYYFYSEHYQHSEQEAQNVFSKSHLVSE